MILELLVLRAGGLQQRSQARSLRPQPDIDEADAMQVVEQRVDGEVADENLRHPSVGGRELHGEGAERRAARGIRTELSVQVHGEVAVRRVGVEQLDVEQNVVELVLNMGTIKADVCKNDL